MRLLIGRRSIDSAVDADAAAVDETSHAGVSRGHGKRAHSVYIGALISLIWEPDIEVGGAQIEHGGNSLEDFSVESGIAEITLDSRLGFQSPKPLELADVEIEGN
jgi:hypothetical protein